MGFLPNETITTVLRHYRNTTGITNWTKNLFVNGGSSAVTVNTAEIGSGYYSFNFTPNAEGYWHLDTRSREDKFKDLLIEIVLLKFKNYRTKEIIKQVIASEVKVTEPVITTTIEAKVSK